MSGFIRTVERWRPMVEQILAIEWPELVASDGVDWILAQIEQESSGEPEVVSVAGAVGLMQLMIAATNEVGFKARDRVDPYKNVVAGVRYLKKQYQRLKWVGSHFDHLAWALAAYNGGYGYASKALTAAQAEAKSEDWRSWDNSKTYLRHPSVRVTIAGRVRYPDVRQITEYVDKIRARFRKAKGE